MMIDKPTKSDGQQALEHLYGLLNDRVVELSGVKGGQVERHAIIHYRMLVEIAQRGLALKRE